MTVAWESGECQPRREHKGACPRDHLGLKGYCRGCYNHHGLGKMGVSGSVTSTLLLGMTAHTAFPDVVVLIVERSLLTLRAVQPVWSPQVLALTALPPSSRFKPFMHRLGFAVHTAEFPSSCLTTVWRRKFVCNMPFHIITRCHTESPSRPA